MKNDIDVISRRYVGKTWLYMGNDHKIRKIEQCADSDKLLRVTTNRTTIQLSRRELATDFLPVDGEIDSNGEGLAVYRDLRKDLEPVGTLSQTLMDTIQKLQKDAKYIDQAKAINETAKNIIEIGKLHVDVLRVIRK